MTENHLPTPFNIEQVAPIFFLVLVDVLGLTVILPLLHLYAAQFNATPFQIGLVVAVFPLAQLIGVPVMGALSDRFGRKPLLLISQISTCVGFVILALANSLWLIVLSRLIDGIFGANLATAQAALSDMTDDAHRTQALGLTGAAFGVGFILGPLIAALSLTFSDNLALPAWIAAGYSLFSIFLTAGMFRETLPAPKRRVESIPRKTVFAAFSMLTDPRINGFLALMFAQQVVFFGFESFLGLFTLSRLGLLGGGNAYIFLAVGIVLVAVQGRFIGRWSRRYGERRLVGIALALLGIGLVLVAFTPRQPPLSYIRARAERELNQRQATTNTYAIDIPANEDRGLWGVPYLLVAIIPLAVGAGMIRPTLNSLITRQVTPLEFGQVLGVSAAMVSAGNALAPLVMGYSFQRFGTTLPFAVGGTLMLSLAIGYALIQVRDAP